MNRRAARPTALLVSATLLGPILAGCGGPKEPSGANLPPVDDSRGAVSRQAPPPQQSGMSTKKKLVLLAGAAALYYMYKKKRDANNQPTERQYYLSKNGRVYYRDESGRAHYVTPPPQGFQIPEEDAREYSAYSGYDGRSSGQDFGGLLAGAR